MSSGTARAVIQRNTVSENKKTTFFPGLGCGPVAEYLAIMYKVLLHAEINR